MYLHKNKSNYRTKMYCISLFEFEWGTTHSQVATQNVNLTLYFLRTHPPPVTSTVAIEKYLPNKPLNVTHEDTPAMSPHVDKKLLRLRSFKSRKLF